MIRTLKGEVPCSAKEKSMKGLMVVTITAVLSCGIAHAQTMEIDGLQVSLQSGNSLTVNLQGAMSRLDVGGSGSITYDGLGRIHKIGNSSVAYSGLGRINAIEGLSITYDGLSRLNRIGASSVTYDGLGRINAIGGSSIGYDGLGRINRVSSRLPEGLRLSFRFVTEP